MNLLTKLKEHKKLLKLEISLASAKESLKFYAKFEKTLRRPKLQPKSFNNEKMDEQGNLYMISISNLIANFMTS